MKVSRVLGCAVVVLCLAHCGKKDDSPAPLSPKEVVTHDVNALPTLDSYSLADYDRWHGNVITSIFGGATGIDVANYFSQRVSYYLTAEEFATAEAQLGDLRTDAFSARSQGQLGAANVGALLWLIGVIKDRSYYFPLAGQSIPVNSTRVGLMLIGPGYNAPIQNQYGETFARPAAARQAILIHEARHSDCTGGLNPDQVKLLKSLKNADDTNERYDRMCGHLHAKCKSGPFEGIQACDDHPWGAYSIGAIFAKAMLSAHSGMDHAIMEAVIADQSSRSIGFDFEDMMRGKHGKPDMGSSGLK